MKYLEYKDTNDVRQVILLFQSFFSNLTFPIDNEIHSAQLYINDNQVINIPGTEFSLMGGNSIEQRAFSG